MARVKSYLELLQAESEDERLFGLKAMAGDWQPECLALLYTAMGDSSWRVRKEAADIFLTLPNATSLVAEIVELLHSQDNAGLRNTAVEILIRFGPQVVSQLIEELTCPDPDVRKFVLDVLGTIGDERSLVAMLGALKDPDSNVRATAAENLGKLGAKEAVPALLAAMEHDDLTLRFTILEALAQIDTPVPVAELLPYNREKLLRKALFDCLGHIGDAEAVPVLLGGLQDNMRNVREAAALALSRLRPREENRLAQELAKSQGQVLKTLTELLDSRDTKVRHATVQLLGFLNSPQALSALLPCLEDPALSPDAAEALTNLARRNPDGLLGLWPSADSRQRTFMAYVIGAAGCVAGALALREALQETEVELLQACARSLGQLGDREALPVLLQLLGQDDEELHDIVVQALAQIGSPHPSLVLEAVMPLLEHENPHLRADAVTILATLPRTAVDKQLAFALKDEAVEVRRAAIRAMEGAESEDQARGLTFALTDEDVEVRRLATEILGGSSDLCLIQPLGLALQDEDLWVRAAAVRSLGRLGGAEAFKLVRSAAEDPVGLVVIAALETLNTCHAEGASELLLEKLRHPDQEVVTSALKLLAESGVRTWIDPLGESLLNHSSWEVRLAVSRYLAALQGAACAELLEARLLIEGEDLVRSEIKDLLTSMAPSRI